MTYSSNMIGRDRATFIVIVYRIFLNEVGALMVMLKGVTMLKVPPLLLLLDVYALEAKLGDTL